MQAEKNEVWWGGGEYPPGKEVTARPAHPTPVLWRQGGVKRNEWVGWGGHLSPGEVATGGKRRKTVGAPALYGDMGNGRCTPERTAEVPHRRAPRMSFEMWTSWQSRLIHKPE